MLVIANLHEPNDAHLGLSSGRPREGVLGGKQSHMLYETLKRSLAVKSGKLRDLTDIELFMPGIGSDKISDLTVNVLRGEFVAYTEEQCKLLEIPTERIASEGIGIMKFTTGPVGTPICLSIDMRESCSCRNSL